MGGVIAIERSPLEQLAETATATLKRFWTTITTVFTPFSPAETMPLTLTEQFTIRNVARIADYIKSHSLEYASMSYCHRRSDGKYEWKVRDLFSRFNVVPRELYKSLDAAGIERRSAVRSREHEQRVKRALELYDSMQGPKMKRYEAIAQQLGVSSRTVQRYVKAHERVASVYDIAERIYGDSEQAAAGIARVLRITPRLAGVCATYERSRYYKQAA
jgi:AraC-like DNA-binding protein